MRYRFFVLVHDAESNALGRALSMALVASQLGEVQVLAFSGKKVWSGSTQFPFQVAIAGGKWKAILDQRLGEVEDGYRNVAWVCKGLSPLDSVVKYVSHRHPDCIVVLDLDDDDSGLARQFMRSSVSNFLRIVRRPRMWPMRITRSQDYVGAHAVGYSFSSWALSERYGSGLNPKVRVPHVRVEGSVDPRNHGSRDESERDLRYGVLGTLRPHKGGDLVLQCMRENRHQILVTFEDCGLGRPGEDDVNWIEIPKETPLPAAYQLIDVAVIAMRGGGRATDLQLPAKLVDALGAGVPIVATPTTAIEEYASGSFIPLPDDVSPDTFASLLESARRSTIGADGYQVYRRSLTPDAVSRELKVLLQATTPLNSSLLDDPN
jgi:hypothetical protein